MLKKQFSKRLIAKNIAKSRFASKKGFEIPPKYDKNFLPFSMDEIEFFEQINKNDISFEKLPDPIAPKIFSADKAAICAAGLFSLSSRFGEDKLMSVRKNFSDFQKFLNYVPPKHIFDQKILKLGSVHEAAYNSDSFSPNGPTHNAFLYFRYLERQEGRISIEPYSYRKDFLIMDKLGENTTEKDLLKIATTNPKEVDEDRFLLNPLLFGSIKELIKKKYLKRFDDFYQYFVRMVNAHFGIPEILVETAKSPTEKEKEILTKFTMNKVDPAVKDQVSIEFKVNENFLGGFKVIINNDLYDYSYTKLFSNTMKLLKDNKS
ncbi:hypothetical protein MHBO_002540 [Bonamia ostreae]|uniref:Uncharacterized protein n=1 Tax=Bonamia ostreae TaxID=126728 RepID=A0ABV2ANG8_9EUKA